jgi:hypothetical protein
MQKCGKLRKRHVSVLFFSKQERALEEPDVIAQIEILRLENDQPGVRLCAAKPFTGLAPVDRALLMAAVIQLCGAAIEAIYADHPDDRTEIHKRLNAVTIEPKTKYLN